MMKITCLVNNFSKNKDLIDEHGLSFFIEKDNIKILFDTGLEKALFNNAKVLDISLKDIDYVVLSHGHNDHTGALREFLEINSKAKVVAHKEIFIEKCSKGTGEMKFIGLVPRHFCAHFLSPIRFSISNSTNNFAKSRE